MKPLTQEEVWYDDMFEYGSVKSAVEMLKEELRIVVNWLEDFALHMGKDETTNWKQHIRIHRREINKRFKKCFPVFQKQLEKEGKK